MPLVTNPSSKPASDPTGKFAGGEIDTMSLMSKAQSPKLPTTTDGPMALDFRIWTLD